MVPSAQILPIFLLVLIASTVMAQTPLTCGIVDIEGPAKVDPGAAVVFNVKITSMIHTGSPQFKWTVSAGTIMTGQGTDVITVDTTGLGGQELTATAELVGAPPGCRASASTTTQVNAPPDACDYRFDEYGDINFEDEKARLDNFAIQLLNVPMSIGSIHMSAGQVTFKNEARERLGRIKSYLVNVRNIDPSRIVTADCGFTQELIIRLRIVPFGSTLPECYNPVEVPFSEVKFIKRRPKSQQKKR